MRERKNARQTFNFLMPECLIVWKCSYSFSLQLLFKQDIAWLHQCTMCCLYSFFSSQPNEVGHDLTPHNCDIIQHILIPTRSVARKTLLWTFSWASNSKFEIFLELYPCSNYRILAFFTPISVWIHGNSIIPPYHTQGDFGYRGILLYKQHIVHWCNHAMSCLKRSWRLKAERVAAFSNNQALWH